MSIQNFFKKSLTSFQPRRFGRDKLQQESRKKQEKTCHRESNVVRRGDLIQTRKTRLPALTHVSRGRLRETLATTSFLVFWIRQSSGGMIVQSWDDVYWDMTNRIRI